MLFLKLSANRNFAVWRDEYVKHIRSATNHAIFNVRLMATAGRIHKDFIFLSAESTFKERRQQIVYLRAHADRNERVEEVYE